MTFTYSRKRSLIVASIIITLLFVVFWKRTTSAASSWWVESWVEFCLTKKYYFWCVTSTSPDASKNEKITPGGKVEYEEGGISGGSQPVAGETVELWDVTPSPSWTVVNPIATAVTDSEGNFSFTLTTNCATAFNLKAKYPGNASVTPPIPSAESYTTLTIEPKGTACAPGTPPYSGVGGSSGSPVEGKKLVSSPTYTPLVKIPGVGAPKNLSQYLVGLYNFLLSVVGIAALLMLVIGGFKYLTAAANPSAASEAKDIISNAVYGLILALLTWVIISTINPDLLVIKQPGTHTPQTISQCATYENGSDCGCVDGGVVNKGSYADCDEACRKEGHCIAETGTVTASCIEPGAEEECICIDGIKISTGGADCNALCSSLVASTSHCLAVDTHLGLEPDNYTYSTKSGLISTTIPLNSKVYLKGEIIDPLGLMTPPYQYTFTFSGCSTVPSFVVTLNEEVATHSHVLDQVSPPGSYCSVDIVVVGSNSVWVQGPFIFYRVE